LCVERSTAFVRNDSEEEQEGTEETEILFTAKPIRAADWNHHLVMPARPMEVKLGSVRTSLFSRFAPVHLNITDACRFMSDL
jgi:hypothetical protein